MLKRNSKMYSTEELNIEEKKTLEEFENGVKDLLSPNLNQDPTIFYRFLKARDFDKVKAEKMLRKYLLWRKAEQIDTITEDFQPKEVYLKYLQPCVIGLDKEGNVVIYIPPGKQEAKDTFRCLTYRDLERHQMWAFEKIMFPKNETTRRAVVIMDLAEISLYNATCKMSRKFILDLVQFAQDNYPERMKYVIVINAPKYCLFMVSLAKALMSNAMIKKLYVYGQTNWKQHLLEIIDADVLPMFLGGNRTDPDGNPMCNSFMIHGGPISDEYTLPDGERYFKDRSQVKTISIPPMEKREIYVDVTEIGSQIQWRFLVKNNDIKFGLSLEISENQVEEILPGIKHSTPDGTTEGSYKCQSIGKYIIIFDNSHSWMSSKEVVYSVQVKTTNILKLNEELYV